MTFIILTLSNSFPAMLKKVELMQDEATKKNVTTAVPVLQSASTSTSFPKQKVDIGISPGQQLIASGTGAIITTLLGKE